MAKPRYIVCSEDRVTDKVTGLVTHFNVIEELAFNPNQSPEQMNLGRVTPWLKMVVTALWSREDDDHEDDVFEHDMRLYKPGSDDPDTLFMGELQFTARNHRLEVMIAGVPFTVAGTIVFESRLRKKGLLDWRSQRYEIPISIAQPPDEPLGE